MLLRPVDGPGWPRDYLLARVRGRLAQIAPTAGDPWPPLLEAARRFYPVLDPAWRREFAPVVGLLEVRALATALRVRQSGDSARAALPLQHSLLHPEILAAATSVTGQLDAVLAVPAATGIRALEATLFDRELTRGRTLCQEPALQLLLRRLIDLRNLLAVHKALRWGMPEPPPLLAGGDIPVRRWERAWRQRSATELEQLVGRLAPGTAGDLPSRLLQDLDRHLTRRARDPLDAAVVLLYGWRLRLTARAGEKAA